MRGAGLALVTVFAGLATVAAKQTFRARTDLVSVYAPVADSSSKVIPDKT